MTEQQIGDHLRRIRKLEAVASQAAADTFDPRQLDQRYYSPHLPIASVDPEYRDSSTHDLGYAIRPGGVITIAAAHWAWDSTIGAANTYNRILTDINAISNDSIATGYANCTEITCKLIDIPFDPLVSTYKVFVTVAIWDNGSSKQNFYVGIADNNGNIMGQKLTTATKYWTQYRYSMYQLNDTPNATDEGYFNPNATYDLKMWFGAATDAIAYIDSIHFVPGTQTYTPPSPSLAFGMKSVLAPLSEGNRVLGPSAGDTDATQDTCYATELGYEVIHDTQVIDGIHDPNFEFSIIGNPTGLNVIDWQDWQREGSSYTGIEGTNANWQKIHWPHHVYIAARANSASDNEENYGFATLWKDTEMIGNGLVISQHWNFTYLGIMQPSGKSFQIMLWQPKVAGATKRAFYAESAATDIRTAGLLLIPTWFHRDVFMPPYPA